MDMDFTNSVGVAVSGAHAILNSKLLRGYHAEDFVLSKVVAPPPRPAARSTDMVRAVTLTFKQDTHLEDMQEMTATVYLQEIRPAIWGIIRVTMVIGGRTLDFGSEAFSKPSVRLPMYVKELLI